MIATERALVAVSPAHRLALNELARAKELLDRHEQQRDNLHMLIRVLRTTIRRLERECQNLSSTNSAPPARKTRPATPRTRA